MTRATEHPHLGVLPRLLGLPVADVLLVLLLLLVERNPLLHDLPLPGPPALLQRVPLHHVEVRQAVADDALLRLEDPVCNVTISVWASEREQRTGGVFNQLISSVKSQVGGKFDCFIDVSLSLLGISPNLREARGGGLPSL